MKTTKAGSRPEKPAAVKAPAEKTKKTVPKRETASKAKAKTSTTPETYEELAEAIKEKARQKGLYTNFFFRSTFENYMRQIQIMKELIVEIESGGVLTEKQYGSAKNIYANPAIGEFNKTCTAANNTVGTLIKILESFAGEDRVQVDPLAELLGKFGSG
jgi:hypothetical protein